MYPDILKTEISFSILAFPPHVNGVFEHRKHKFLRKMLSRVKNKGYKTIDQKACYTT